MKIEFPAWDSEPLFYFLYHSGLFLILTGVAFFALGLLFGLATWRRYKVRAQRLKAEVEAMRSEIVDLKCKIADLALRTATPTPLHATATPLPRSDLLPDSAALDERTPAQATGTPAPTFAPAVPTMPELPATPATPASGPQRARRVAPPPRRSPPAPISMRASPEREPAAISPFSFIVDEPASEPGTSTSPENAELAAAKD